MKNHFSKHFNDDSLIAHLDGELRAGLDARLRRHLQSCWPCRLRLSELEAQVIEVTRAVQDDHFPGVGRVAAAKERFLADTARFTAPATREWSFGWMRWLSPAAAAAGLALAATGWFWYSTPASPPKTVTEVRRKVEARPPANAIELPAPTPAVKPNPESASSTDLISLEIETQYALHHVGACLGEPVEVERSGDGMVRVRGTAPTEERRMAWQAALSAVRRTPWLRVEVTSTEQALLHLDSTAAPREEPAAPAAAAAPPIQNRLERHFAAQSESSRRAAALSNDVVTHAETMLAHAWALRRLDRKYPPDRTAAEIPAAATHLLETMRAEHREGLRAELRHLGQTTGPLLGEDSTTPVEEATAATSEDAVFEHSRRLHSLLMLLFTTAGAGQDPDALVRLARPEFQLLDRAVQDAGPTRIAKETP